MSNDDLQKKLSGKFIVLDGPDGCGKTTQAKLLAEWISKQGVEMVLLRDPGATAIGEKIRRILLDPQNTTMTLRTELLLYMAARAQLWQEKITSALANGKCVILDRWVSSTCAYQGWAGGFGIENVIKLAESCLERVWPDLTVILDVDLETASARLDRQLDRMEQKGREYHKKVRQGFLELAGKGDKIIVIDAAGDVEGVHEKIKQVVISAKV